MLVDGSSGGGRGNDRVHVHSVLLGFSMQLVLHDVIVFDLRCEGQTCGAVTRPKVLYFKGRILQVEI